MGRHINTGLLVGATLQLMVLGVGTFGGSSIPDFWLEVQSLVQSIGCC